MNNLKSIVKIIHTTCHTHWGGLEKRIFRESVWMDEKGHTVVIIAPRETPLFTKARDYGFKTYALDFSKLGFYRDYKSLKAIFNNEQPDILNTHGNMDAKIALPAAKKARVPLRILSRHISAHVNNSWYNRLLYKRLSDCIFTTADYTTRHLKETFKLNEMQIFSIPSGIQIPGEMMEKKAARQNLIEDLKLDQDVHFIGFVGRLAREKGVPSIIEAFKIISVKRPDLHVVLVGHGGDDYIKLLRQKAAALSVQKQVHFVGYHSDVWRFYRALDCNVLPSKNFHGIPFEGVPQSIIEAMASECPVVGSKSGGITDIIDHDKTGLLFDPEDYHDLAEKILSTVEDKEKTKKRIAAARKFVMEHYTIDTMGKNILRIYGLHQNKFDRKPN